MFSNMKYRLSFSISVPEGPPTKVEGKTNTSTSLEVIIHLPSDEIVNGIVLGYNVSYYETDTSKRIVGATKSIIFYRMLNKNITTGIIYGLDEYTWYGITAKAFTSIGLSQNESEPVFARTDEAGE